MHAIHFELERAFELTPAGEYIMLDDWFSKWNQALSDKKIKLLPPLPPVAPQAPGG